MFYVPANVLSIETISISVTIQRIASFRLRMTCMNCIYCERKQTVINMSARTSTNGWRICSLSENLSFVDDCHRSKDENIRYTNLH